MGEVRVGTAGSRNVRARYPIHFHLNTPQSLPKYVIGCSVVGSPGWGDMLTMIRMLK